MIISSAIKRATYSIITSIACLLTLALMITVSYGAITRYLLRSPNPYTYPLSIWLWGMIFLLGFGLAHYEKAHIFVDIVYNLGSPTLKRALGILSVLIALLSIVIVLPNTVEFARRSFLIFERDSTIPLFTPPIWWYKGFLTFVLLLALLQVIDSIINEVSDKRSKH